jgi:hypothetical protein
MNDPVSFQNNSTIDAFSRLRVSSPTTIFDSKQISDALPLFWDDQQTSGTASSTYNANQASTTIAVSLNTAGTRVRQTFRHFNYQPGKSQAVLFTCIPGTGQTDVTKQWGLFNASNGLFFQQVGTALSVVRRTNTSGSPVDTTVAQSSWNIDKMDGTGPSGYNLDVTKTQIFVIDFEWLGVGRVRWGIVINGLVQYVHQTNHSNSLSLVYMSTPNLPLRCSISNGGAGAAASFVHICTSVMSEGGSQEIGFPRAISRLATAMTTANDALIYPVLGIRLASGYLGITVRVPSFTITCTSTAAYNVFLMLNPVITGTAITWAALTNSSLETFNATTNATSVSAGTTLRAYTGQSTNEGLVQGALADSFALGSTIAGVSDQLILAVQRVTGTSEAFYGSLNIQELL